MRRYLVDTTILGAYLANRSRAVSLLSPWIARREVATSILVYGELIEHLQGKPDFIQRRAQLRELLNEIVPYLLTYAVVERYATIRRQLRHPHGSGLIGDIDTLIAATAIEHGLTLVTSDTDFERVPNLTLLLVPRDQLRS